MRWCSAESVVKEVIFRGYVKPGEATRTEDGAFGVFTKPKYILGSGTGSSVVLVPLSSGAWIPEPVIRRCLGEDFPPNGYNSFVWAEKPPA